MAKYVHHAKITGVGGNGRWKRTGRTERRTQSWSKTREDRKRRFRSRTSQAIQQDRELGSIRELCLREIDRLFKRQNGERERDRQISPFIIHWFTPQMPSTSKSVPG